MFEKLRAALLPLLRVPPEPEPPFGAPGSVRVFRAGRNYYKLKLLVWSFGQLATLAGIIFSIGSLARLHREATQIREERLAAANAGQAAAAQPENPLILTEPAETTATPAPSAAPKNKRHADAFWHDPNNPLGRLLDRSPWWLFPLIAFLEFVGIAGYLIQLPVTYALLRLEFDAHWYIVTDRSLRIRWGLVTVREATMSFANIQQVTVSQIPIQRLLRLSNVLVQSAGGGKGGDEKSGHGDDSMHTGVFHSVENPTEIRDLILDRLRQFRAAGLGDPDDHREESHGAEDLSTTSATTDIATAARDVLQEARALRATLT